MAKEMTNTELLDLAKDLDDMDRKVTTWESEFLDSVLRVLVAGGSLSAKQREILIDMETKYLESNDDEEDEDEHLRDRFGETPH